MFDRAKSPEAKGNKLGRGDLRLSNAGRTDAIRRLEVHKSMGHLTGTEAEARVTLVRGSTTPDQVAKLFVDLPALPARPPSNERRISTQDRDDAIDLLEKARLEGRIEEHEHAAAKAQVRAARTRSELDAAFHGLSTPTHAAVVKTASNVTKQAAGVTARVAMEGGRRVGKAFRHGALAVGALMIGVILVVAGIGTAAIAFFVLAVLLFTSATIALVASS